jgi:hypothetical protein
MATNPPKGDNHRHGAVRNRSQVFNPANERWTKRDTGTGRFMDQKADRDQFKAYFPQVPTTISGDGCEGLGW